MTTSRVMTMLNERVPITLLCDLATVIQPDSDAINDVERPGDDVIWLEAAAARSSQHSAVSA